MEDASWDAGLYDAAHAFVHEYGEDLIDLLAPTPGERILDLGCGTGHLTNTIADTDADVVGLDNAAAMIKDARRNYPEITFVHADAAEHTFTEPFDAVFSNAALHWITPPEPAAATIHENLRPGGRFVAELGGTGNIDTITEALYAAAERHGYDIRDRNPWYFPTIGEYATVLDASGLEVRYARLFDRPTSLDGPDGLRNWLTMFADTFFTDIPPHDHDPIITTVEDTLRPDAYHDDAWIADYRRLRIRAIKPHTTPP